MLDPSHWLDIMLLWFWSWSGQYRGITSAKHDKKTKETSTGALTAATRKLSGKDSRQKQMAGSSQQVQQIQN